MDVAPCRCGHVRESHEHYHDRTYCGSCPCRAFRRPRGALAAATADRITRALALLRGRR